MGTITIEAYDDNGNQLFSYQVGFAFEIDVQQLLQLAFVQGQSASQPDPFSYTLDYYGYSQSAQYPGYLGYELESINAFDSDANHYWELAVNGQPSSSGIDTTFPNPGATVTFTYQTINTRHLAANSRQKAIQERRAARSGARLPEPA
ncbi:DUF4430 domain-containing protein [Ralstonia solanacearum]|uniref:DUF4430 domain-containing protein n=1 Tax=Ralstonia solanacearum TaxID=305 RepID=UPI00018170F3|nr:DUF4430 domain-containing protein [Ralstonia solanacearum]MDC6180107.1 DUF4430 domain-containing protein [Ralstonia solanacearum]MDC6213277.1 DUF4430 domain-containing protein [Ralstonia solanacearum]MDC6241330.1 DUF4430 domain-containing protein [Ralstonia solanacearum]MDD7803002.1 DUF4430 domain-containing protein [Ralstonia solanacearum]TYZ53190.1 DUF4430 domain-containing protein [Ralstonia solanacearum]